MNKHLVSVAHCDAPLVFSLRYNTLFAIPIVVYQLAPPFARAAFFHSRSERIYFSSHASGKAGEFLSVPVDRNVWERTGFVAGAGFRRCGDDLLFLRQESKSLPQE
ncbi:MAG: hypothetical protein LIO54_02685 [Oscillospiraceae bacterium]|nr:hypothetical protein [Oscillospiraceae bacterium]